MLTCWCIAPRMWRRSQGSEYGVAELSVSHKRSVVLAVPSHYGSHSPPDKKDSFLLDANAQAGDRDRERSRETSIIFGGARRAQGLKEREESKRNERRATQRCALGGINLYSVNTASIE